jgi:low temperature requirement protein LtrA
MEKIITILSVFAIGYNTMQFSKVLFKSKVKYDYPNVFVTTKIVLSSLLVCYLQVLYSTLFENYIPTPGQTSANFLVASLLTLGNFIHKNYILNRE